MRKRTDMDPVSHVDLYFPTVNKVAYKTDYSADSLDQVSLYLL